MLAKVFDIVGGEVVITPETLALPFFKVIWNRDKSKTKENTEFEMTEVQIKMNLRNFFREIK